MNDKIKIVRAVTVSSSINFYKGLVSLLQSAGYDIVSISSPGREVDDLKDMGVNCYDIPMERHISVFKDLLSLLKIINVFRKEKPTIVHSMTPKAGLLCMIAGLLTRVPIRIHTFTGLVWPTSVGLKRKILILTDRITCFCATHIIPEGQGVLSDLQNHVTKKPMKVLGFGNVKGVDMTRFSRRLEIINSSRNIRNENCFTFIFVGRLVGDKGINELIEAFVRLSKDIVNVRLILVGKYEEKLDPLKKETLSLINNNAQINVVGPKYGDDLISYYAASDCLVFPSYREGFPNTVMEAGAMGLPSIVTDINGSREIIINDKNGIIIPSKDVDALYEAMKQMIVDNSAREKMVANARPLIESRFEKSFVQDCLIKFYDEILNK